MIRHVWLGGALALASVGTPAGAAAQIAVNSSAVMEREARPGERYEGAILLRNTTAEPQEAKVYLTDYQFFADGRTLYEAAGTDPRSSARWIALSASHVTIPPAGTATVGFTVRVPAGSAGPLEGTYWSMVMVEAIAAGSAESARRPAAGAKPELGVRTTLRYGTQVVTHVAGTGASRVEFVDPKLVAGSDGAKALELDVVNSGSRAHRPKLSIELFTEQGVPAGKVASARGLVYPGSSIRQRFELGAIPAGTYRALVVADTGGDAVFGAQYTLRF